MGTINSITLAENSRGGKKDSSGVLVGNFKETTFLSSLTLTNGDSDDRRSCHYFGRSRC
jgi:hypothetical protein